MVFRDLKLLDAAEQMADMVNELIDRLPRGQVSHARQLRDAAQSVPSNIREAYGRGGGRDREHRLRIARGEAEEALGHMGVNFRSKRIPRRDYWRIRNRLVVISKMLTAVIGP